MKSTFTPQDRQSLLSFFFQHSSPPLSLPSAWPLVSRILKKRGRWLKWSHKEPSWRVVFKPTNEPRVRLGKVCRLQVKSRLFSSHGNLNHFHPVDCDFQLPLASPVILPLYRMLVSLGNRGVHGPGRWQETLAGTAKLP